MSNGNKKIVFNTRERVISNDHNRLQDIIAQTSAATMARLHGDQYNVESPGYAPQLIVGGQTPMVADVYGGLFVKVDDPNSLFVDAGVVGVVDPDASPGLDDDPYNVITDPGVNTGGILSWSPNASGSIRIDLVVADVTEQVLETDNRDIFDPSTGLFTPVTVNKVMAKRLVHSIVIGTPGAGIPVIPNQIVLAVASVPDGTVSWADVTFWDVRPLVQARIEHYKNLNDKRRYYDFDFDVTSTTHAGYAFAEFDGYLAGGRLMTSVPGLGDVAFNDFTAENATNNDVTLIGDVGANPIFLLFPSGLPRWARYSEGNAPNLTIRAPYGTTGILTAGRARAGVTDYAKADEFGNATGVTIPPSTGLTGTSNGVLLYMRHIGSFIGNPDFTNTHGRGRRIMFEQQQASGSSSSQSVTDDESGTWSAADSELFHNITDWWNNGTIAFPQNARVISLSWDPPPIQTDVGVAPPNLVSYNELGLFIKQESTYLIGHWSYMGVGDGTTVPQLRAQESIEIGIDRAVTPVRLECGVTQSSGSVEAPNVRSRWEFSGADTSTIYVLGYEF